jgi:hypothetical protein
MVNLKSRKSASWRPRKILQIMWLSSTSPRLITNELLGPEVRKCSRKPTHNMPDNYVWNVHVSRLKCQNMRQIWAAGWNSDESRFELDGINNLIPVPERQHRLWGSHNLLSGTNREAFTRTKAVGTWRYYLTPSRAEVKSECNYTFGPPYDLKVSVIMPSVPHMT